MLKLKLICIQVFWDLLGQAIEYDKVLKLSSGAQLELALSPSHLQSGDVKATIAVLGFIISSAAKHSIDNESLSSELQQLGLPKGRGSPQGGTISQTCWDVAYSSQPCLLHTQMEGRLPAVLSSITSLLYHPSLGAPQVLW
ncbi:COMM domain-containing protein 4-like [Ammospiza nelsoni]|uniref:COMM domain-containing protein 4-like n=1 Tax=Ammospiza nelsoni TaxID=2857394 RepID=UPI00286A348B|nr:COMM domain-containing protein 4-like [Ammospiza nelsoni]